MPASTEAPPERPASAASASTPGSARKPAEPRGTRSASVGSNAAGRAPGVRSTRVVARRPSSSAATCACTPSRRGLSSVRPATPASPEAPSSTRRRPIVLANSSRLAAPVALLGGAPVDAVVGQRGRAVLARAVDRAGHGGLRADHEVVAGEGGGGARRQREQPACRRGCPTGGRRGGRACAGRRRGRRRAAISIGCGPAPPPSSSATAASSPSHGRTSRSKSRFAGAGRQRRAERRHPLAHGGEAAGEREQAGVLRAPLAGRQVRVEPARRAGRAARPRRPARRRRGWRARRAMRDRQQQGAADDEHPPLGQARSSSAPLAGAACARRSR